MMEQNLAASCVLSVDGTPNEGRADMIDSVFCRIRGSWEFWRLTQIRLRIAPAALFLGTRLIGALSIYGRGGRDDGAATPSSALG
jgi:hypothetical protein